MMTRMKAQKRFLQTKTGTGTLCRALCFSQGLSLQEVVQGFMNINHSHAPPPQGAPTEGHHDAMMA